MKAFLLFLVLGSFVRMPVGASGGVQQPEPMGTPYDEDGYSVVGKFGANECLVGSDVDLKTMVAKMRDLQTKGLIKPDVDEEHLKAHAWTTASAIALRLEPLVIHSTYSDHAKVDHCVFVQTITGLDGKDEMAFAFELSRADYKKIDFASVTPESWPELVNNFKIGPVVAKKMKDEN
jgi:hypothetical protein